MHKSSIELQGNIANTLLSDAVFRPMLFSTPMVQALLNGTKTQTRRIVNGTIPIGNFDETLKKSILKVGDIIWVRETFAFAPLSEETIEIYPDLKTSRYIYKSGSSYVNIKWKPSLFMPKEACRLWLKVTNIRIERLQDLTGEDALQEGVVVESMWPMAIGDAYRAYQTLWESINGKGTWDANPFVWVYDFEVIREAPYGFR